MGGFVADLEGRELRGGDFGSRKARAVLKLLVVNRGHIMSVDALAALVWDEDVPDRADRYLATLVSRLRTVLGSDVIVKEGPGYRLGAHYEVDVDVAEHFVAEAESRLTADEPALAEAAAERTLDILERGALLEDEPYAEWAAEARLHADGLLRRARRCAWQAALQISDFEAAVTQAQAALSANPLDAEACAALMRALSGAGRPAEALAAFDRLGTVLSQELGVDPAPETRRLHQAILREEPAPPKEAVGQPRLRRALDPDFVGRGTELSQLAATWRRALAGEGGLVLVSGEAGIGKTRLANEIVDAARATGGVILRARCYQAERSLFLQPFVDAIRSTVSTLRPDVVREAASDWAPVLGELVPDVELMLRPPARDRATPDIERRRSFQAVTAFLRSLSRRHPLLFLVDDIHNAGSSTLELLHFLVRRSLGMRLLVVATLRVEEGAPVLEHVRDVSERLELGPLPDEAVAELAARLGAAEVAESVMARTRGHTLFVVEMLRALAEGGRDVEEVGVPESLKETVLARVHRVGSDVEEFLRVAAVIGSSFELDVAAQMLEITFEEAVRCAERAHEARLLVEAGEVFEFANDMIQEILYQATPLPARVARHKRAAALLSDRPEAAASHADAAGEWATAAEAWLRAGERAAERFASPDVLALLDRALAAASHLDDPILEARIRIARGRVKEALADYEGASVDHSTAVSLARSSGQRALEMAGLRELGGDVIVGMGRPTVHCIPYLEQALPIAVELGDRRAEANIQSRLAVISTNRLHLASARAHSRRALERARELEDPHVIALALDGVKTVAAYSGDFATLERVLPELESLLRRQGNLWYLQWTIFESSFIPMARGSWDEATARIEAAVDLNRRTGYRAYEPMYLSHLGWIHRSKGEYTAALESGRQAVALCEETPHPWWAAFSEAMLGWTLTELGAIDEASIHLQRGLEAAERDGAESYLLRCLSHLALAAQLGGDGGRAGTLLHRTEEILQQSALLEESLLLHAGHAYIAFARTYLARGNGEGAERMCQPLIAAAETSGWLEVAADASLVAGLCRLAADDLDSAAALLERSLSIAERSGLVRIEWESHLALAQGLFARRVSEGAQEHVLAARRIVERIGTSIRSDPLRSSYLESTSVPLDAQDSSIEARR